MIETLPPQPAPPEGALLPTPDEAPSGLPVGARVLEAPAGLPVGARPLDDEPPEEYSASIPERIVGRLFGTDVDDPMPWTRLGTTLAGGVGGGIAGSRLPGAMAVPGALGGGVFGTVAGATSPEMTLEFLEKIGLLSPGTRAEIGMSPSELRTLAENEALLDMATLGAFTVARAVVRPTVRFMTGAGTKGAQDTAEAAARQNIELMPIQVGDRTVPRAFVAVAGRMPWLGTPLRRAGAETERQLGAAVGDIGDRIGPLYSMDSISRQVFDDAQNLLKATNSRFRTEYGALWARADASGVSAAPRATTAKADEVLARIKGRSNVSATGEPLPPSKSLQRLQDFIETDILPMRSDASGMTAYAKQSLRQLDGLITKIDEEIASVEPSVRRFVKSELVSLRQAVQADMLTNLRGPNAAQIAADMKALDTDFAQTMSGIFETSVAKSFGSVERGGLRGIRFDEATRIPVDQLARHVLKLESPQAIDELSRLVNPETMQRLAARVFDDAVSDSMVRTGDGIMQFSPDRFARIMGLSRADTAKRSALDKLLEHSGSPLRMTDMDDILTAARAIESAEIPNVSSFIARRATIGGIRSVINAAVPGLVIAGGASAGGSTGIIASLALLMGSRGISRALSNPTTARALKDVIQDEARGVVIARSKWEAIVRGTIGAAQNAGDITRDAATNLTGWADEVLDLMLKEAEDNQGLGLGDDRGDFSEDDQ